MLTQRLRSQAFHRTDLHGRKITVELTRAEGNAPPTKDDKEDGKEDRPRKQPITAPEPSKKEGETKDEEKVG